MSEIPKTRVEIEAILRAAQARNEIPRYICYWANGSVTQGDEYAPVREASLLARAEQARKILVGYLTPHRQMHFVWDPEGSFKVGTSFQCAYTGDKTFQGLWIALEDMEQNKVSPWESSWATIERTTSVWTPWSSFNTTPSH